jgi:diguanylate cyclase (GGDEF)-like protein
MNQLPLGARVFLAATTGAGVCVVGVSLAFASFPNPPLLVVLFVLAVVTAVLINLPVSTTTRTLSATASRAVDLTTLLVLGPDAAMLVATVGGWSRASFRVRAENPRYGILFRMAGQAIAMRVAGQVYLEAGGRVGRFGDWSWVLPYVAATVLYITMTTAAHAALNAVTARPRVAGAWKRSLGWKVPSWLLAASAAPVCALLLERSAMWLFPLAAGPLVVTYLAHSLYVGGLASQEQLLKEASGLQMATIEALAIAIDAKDRSSPSHIRREQLYAAALAREFGMSELEIQGVKTAALLHDIGKLAVPEHILSKPGPLTLEEFQKVRIHPQVGAEIIAGVPFPYPVAPLVLCHHERWNGTGYPAGLKGAEIPLGARVLAVVDYFEALTSERPFHRAISYDAAIDILWQEAGKALDPVAVAHFVELLPSLRPVAPSPDAKQPLVHGTGSVADTARNREAAGSAQTPVLHDIALAHREIYSLYEVSQAMGTSLGVADSMTLIASKLRNLVPFSACALFLADKESDAVRCRFATGAQAEWLRQVTVHDGQGNVGWAVAHRESVRNGNPAEDLEAAGLQSAPAALGSALVCPLVFNERAIGALALYHVETGFFTEDHRRLASRVSEQIAAVVYNSIIFEQTQEDSLTDPLTGLPNTRFLFMHLGRELARSARLGSSLALFVLDLDNLKDINDTFGHHVGDRALREVAGVLRAAIRPYDICVRYGGDEFIVVLSECGVEECEAKRVELQRAVEAVPFEARGGRRIQMGISVGAAVFPSDGDTYEGLLATADNRMYRDKGLRKSAAASLNGGRSNEAALSPEDLRRAASGVL